MVVAIALFWTAGLVLSLRRGNFAKSLLVGGGLFSISQFFPFAQMIAGILALEFWQSVTDRPADGDSLGDVHSELGGFVVTILTGLQLLAVAVVGGYCVRGVARLAARPPALISSSRI